MTDLIHFDATALAALIRTKALSPVEVLQAHLDRIAAVDPAINAIVTLADGALAEARAAEKAVLDGDELGPLHGVPFTVKDSIDTAGLLTQRGSPIFKGRVPDADATSVVRLKQAGGILLAKTNLPEFSYAIETDNLLSGRANNPWDPARTPGGSSGGESAAIAAGMSPLGLGSDVAISLRGPAAMTGIVALKASHGRIPMTGLWPRVPRRFWHVGPMARSVRDIALAYGLLAGPDGADGYAMHPPSLDAGIGKDPDRPLRVGWLTEPGFGPVDAEVAATVKAAAEALRAGGAVVEEVRIPALEAIDGNDIFWKLQLMETMPHFKTFTDGHDDQVFKYVRALYDSPETSIGDYVAAEQTIEQLRDGLAAYFQRYDVLLCPVTPVTAQPHGATALSINGETVSPRNMIRATVPFNLTGLPGLSLRFGTSREGMPINVQIVARPLAESTVLHAGAMLEQASPARGLWPSL